MVSVTIWHLIFYQMHQLHENTCKIIHRKSNQGSIKENLTMTTMVNNECIEELWTNDKLFGLCGWALSKRRVILNRKIRLIPNKSEWRQQGSWVESKCNDEKLPKPITV